MRYASGVSLAVTALNQPSGVGQRFAPGWRRIVCSKPATVCLAPDPMRRAALCAMSVPCHSQRQPLARRHVAGRASRLAGGGSCAASLPPSALRQTPCGGQSYALCQQLVTCSDRISPALMRLATLCALLAADRVQQVCHRPPCAQPQAAGRAMRYAIGMSLAVTASLPPSCGGTRSALRLQRIACSKPATVRHVPVPKGRAALCAMPAACHSQ